jgi:uncharacterized protein YxjI
MQTSIRLPSSTPSTGSAEQRPELLDRQTFLVRERVGFAKLTDTFDILDPSTQRTIGIAKEEPPGWAKWLRLLVNKRFLPTTINVYEAEGRAPELSIHRSFTFLRAKIEVREGGGRPMGYLKNKLFSLGGGFRIYDLQDQEVAELKGDWKGWDFKFLGKDGRQLGRVTKKWAGIGKELFTSADTYVISLDGPTQNRAAATLLLAAGLAVDIVLKER